MRILINTATTFKGGGVQVAKSFIEECQNFQNNHYFVVLSKELKGTLNLSGFSDSFSFFDAPFRPATKIFSFTSHNVFLKRIERKCNPDIVFTTSGPSYWRPKCVHLMGYNLPHYIYPESPYFSLLPIKRKIWWRAMKVYAKYIFKRDADALVVQTNDVNVRVKKLLNKQQVFTVSNTINTHYLNPVKFSNKLPDKVKTEIRLLTLSASYPHKNLSIISKVAKILKKKGYNFIKFVVTIPDEDFDRLFNKSMDLIINVGPIKIEEAPSLYNECDGMFLPTLLECFSASYVEAMKMKKPILTSDMGFAHTICEDSAVYFNPMDAADIADKIIALFNSMEEQNRLVRNGLERLKTFGSPSERAKRYLEICDELTPNFKSHDARD